MKRPIIVRMDDICETMDFTKFKKYKALFDEYQIKPLLGIVPKPKDEKLRKGFVPDFWEYIKSLAEDGWPIAMHGVNHVYISESKGLVTSRPKSEFAGIPFEKQSQMIREGEEELRAHGITTDIFMAPGHSYDRNTLKALKANGFNFVSDGRSSHPYILDGIKCIPADSAYRLNKYGILTICVHANEESDLDFARLEAFLREHGEQIMNFTEAVVINPWPYTVCRMEEKMRIVCRKAVLTLIRKR